MSRHPELARRVLLGAGLAVTAAGALGAPAVAAGSRSARGFAAPSISGTGAWDARSASGSIDVLDSKPSKIIVHHTATPNSSDTSQSHAFALSRQIQDFHMDSNGWIDTGQNFTNSRGGHLTEGRHKSLAALQGGSQHVLGAHAGEQNDVALGIENEGTYTDASVPDALWESLVELCSYMISQYGIKAGAIYGHRDFMSTACPGDVLYARLPDLREAVGSATGRRVVQPVVWPLLRPESAGPVVSALQLLLRAQGSGVVVNGVFDAATEDAVAGFRRVRGVAGASCFATRVVEPVVFGGGDWARLVPVLGVDAGGDAVRAVQVLLTARGVHSGEQGRFGVRTAGAVRELQAAHGLRVTGVCDRETWLRLLA
ncbi:N-acetylmuramoyl-L-alanine amidase [Saccharopolyspora gloriosae]|uniref:peptidoglycan recognition protein family protein n=1 Tax=Saccharopolyspora gloriosae TaxID=455344 RepID=UPI00215E63E9|nr:peptidoglycan-binding protein [Saccharopolyspora gloriosae]